MWVMSSFGILMPAIRPPKTVARGDDRTLQIRSRRARDLDTLRAEYMKGKLGPTIHTPKMDYNVRAYCTPESFALALAQMAMEIDYLKFKPTTDRYEDDELHDCYNGIWSVVMNRLSPIAHQNRYWSQHGSSDWTWRPSGTGYGAVSTAGGYVSPKGQTITTLDLSSGADTERDRLDKWLEDADRRDNPTGRNTSADRDEYLPESWTTDDTAEPKLASTKVIDDLYDEIEAILDAERASGPIEHSKCFHANTPNAKAKCRAKHRKAVEKRVAALRVEIRQAYDDAEKDFGAESLSDVNGAVQYALS